MLSSRYTKIDPMANTKPHAVCFPLPIQGHINGMLHFSKALYYMGFHIVVMRITIHPPLVVKERRAEKKTWPHVNKSSTTFVIIDHTSPRPHRRYRCSQYRSSSCRCLSDRRRSLRPPPSLELPPEVVAVTSSGYLRLLQRLSSPPPAAITTTPTVVTLRGSHCLGS
ncbi:hypothetical protein ZIOFF_049962 [Zingiber officinale]|uniref:Uncharacterized protein n=1 Tax=Zingiber officinale TaxID=94328 RepID=A0A8J5FJJ2_ZINOF|nr:hypothetical protein ZIOFF_049962 [Zingiber officinale]